MRKLTTLVLGATLALGVAGLSFGQEAKKKDETKSSDVAKTATKKHRKHKKQSKNANSATSATPATPATPAKPKK